MYNLYKESKVNTLIPDNSEEGLVSTIRVLKEGTINSLKVHVNVSHPYVGDLAVSLAGPNGESVQLHQRKGGNSNDLNKTYEGDVLNDFVGSQMKGSWKLICKDFAPRDSGTLNHWSVEMQAEENAKTGTDIFTKNEQGNTLKSSQHCRYVGTVSKIKAFVDIDHAKEDELVISLKSPSGKEVTMHNKAGRGRFEATTFKGKEMSDFVGEKCTGIWQLNVKDASGKDTNGQLRKWKLFMEYEPIDNLSNIDGLGNKAEAVLNQAGIRSFSSLATTSPNALTEIFKNAKGNFDNINVDNIRSAATAEVESYRP